MLTEFQLENFKEEAHVGHRRGWEYNIIIYHNGLSCKVMDCIHLTQDNVQWRILINTTMNLRVP
jgi:hypothetical protein